MNERPSSQASSNLNAEQVGERALVAIEGLQAELDELRDQLAQSNRLGQLGMLTAALAHEINNFLTPMRSYAQLALANPSDAVLTERALQATVDGSQKTSRLAERVMELASPNSTLQTSVCMVNEAIDSAIEAIQPVLKQDSIEMRVDVISAEVRIDALALEQVVINLIGNACEAMRRGTDKRQIRIDSSTHASTFQLTIRDTGPGVPDSIRNQLFEPFISDRAKSRAGGSGLGLSICKQLIEAAGGSIALQSTSGQGSVFVVNLPLAEVH